VCGWYEGFFTGPAAYVVVVDYFVEGRFGAESTLKGQLGTETNVVRP